uniref:Uncharacterized protein n=1 Tax=Plectus sambesii TaxID=2011161 RepID=A0A914WI01_9BILA
MRVVNVDGVRSGVTEARADVYLFADDWSLSGTRQPTRRIGIDAKRREQLRRPEGRSIEQLRSSSSGLRASQCRPSSNKYAQQSTAVRAVSLTHDQHPRRRQLSERTSGSRSTQTPTTGISRCGTTASQGARQHLKLQRRTPASSSNFHQNKPPRPPAASVAYG